MRVLCTPSPEGQGRFIADRARFRVGPEDPGADFDARRQAAIDDLQRHEDPETPTGRRSDR